MHLCVLHPVPWFLMCILFYLSFIWLHVYAVACKSMVHCGNTLEQDAFGLPYYCASICVRSCCTWRANCVDSKPKKKKRSWRNPGLIPQYRFNKTKQHTLAMFLSYPLFGDWGCDLSGACVSPGVRANPSTRVNLLARRASLVGGVPFVGPQEELRGPSGYTPRGLTSSRCQAK